MRYTFTKSFTANEASHLLLSQGLLFRGMGFRLEVFGTLIALWTMRHINFTANEVNHFFFFFITLEPRVDWYKTL